MILTLDIGNTQILAGVFAGDNTKQSGEEQLVLRFRRTSTSTFSSDELGVFLRGSLRENDIDPKNIRAISLCSVVPSLVYSSRSACKKYFDLTPFVLEAGVKTGLKIRYKNPSEVGADRIANGIAAVQQFPGKNMIIIDMGTATTFCAISKDKDYLGGTIVPGIKISMDALEQRTAKLHSVEILRPESTLGQTTTESIQSGLFYSHLGAMKEIVGNLKAECFSNEDCVVVGTGGISHLFTDNTIFDIHQPDLALIGLYRAYQMNT